MLPSKANQAASEVWQQLIVYTHRNRDYANLFKNLIKTSSLLNVKTLTTYAKKFMSQRLIGKMLEKMLRKEVDEHLYLKLTITGEK
ncbi:hypothetical protein DB41_HN00190 [Neochlamydia sp. TUME1]|nr:hypothetical protein DB41_HN00190 [Neochlamydia sp. TUME1]